MMIDPIPTARNIVAETIELRDGQTVEPYVVWFCYILGGWKALLSTPVEDGRYYEVTYDKAKGCVYVDTYRKEDNEMVYLDGAGMPVGERGHGGQGVTVVEARF